MFNCFLVIQREYVVVGSRGVSWLPFIEGLLSYSVEVRKKKKGKMSARGRLMTDGKKR